MSQKVIISKSKREYRWQFSSRIITPRAHQDSALLTALTNIIAHNSKENNKQEFKWQPNYRHDNRNTF